MDFATHHQIVTHSPNPPSQALLEAIKIIKAPSMAIDLGCGAGTDTGYLLKKGWEVLAVDADQDVLDLLSVNYAHSGLKTFCQRFESLRLPPAQLINACFSLPFCEPVSFDLCWETIINSITSGGLFSGQFFGDRDSWIRRPNMTFHNSKQINQLFEKFEFIWQLEVERDGRTLGGESKHWHVHHVVARKL